MNQSATLASSSAAAGGDQTRREGEELGRLIAAGQIDEDVEARLDQALARSPADVRLRLLRVDLFDATGRRAEAEAVLRSLWEAVPDNPWPGHRLVGRLLDERRTDEARAAFTRFWRGHPPEPMAVALLNRMTAAIPDLAARKPLLEALLDGSPADRFALVKLASLAFRAHDRATAMALFDKAASLGPLPAEGSVLHIDLLTVSGRYEEAADLARDAVAADPDRRDLVRKAIQTADLCNRHEDVSDLLVRSIERWPDDWMTLFRYNRAAIDFALDRALFERLKALARPDRDDRWSFQLAIASLRHGEKDRALAILDAMGPDSPAAALALPLRAALDGRPRASWTNARALSNDPADDIQTRRRDDAVATCLVFAGVQGGLGYLPFSFADTLFADRPLNMVYLRDRSNMGFTRGIASLGEGETAMLDGLRGIAAELGGRPLIAVGASLGGVAAVRVGLALDAAALLSFAAPLAAVEGADGAARFRAEAIGNFQQQADLRDPIAARPHARLYHCYGAGHPSDRAMAEALRPLPNVTLVPVACEDHFPLQHLLATGEFDRLLDRIVAELPR